MNKQVHLYNLSGLDLGLIIKNFEFPAISYFQTETFTYSNVRTGLANYFNDQARKISVSTLSIIKSS